MHFSCISFCLYQLVGLNGSLLTVRENLPLSPVAPRVRDFAWLNVVTLCTHTQPCLATTKEAFSDFRNRHLHLSRYRYFTVCIWPFFFWFPCNPREENGNISCFLVCAWSIWPWLLTTWHQNLSFLFLKECCSVYCEGFIQGYHYYYFAIHVLS